MNDTAALHQTTDDLQTDKIEIMRRAMAGKLAVAAFGEVAGLMMRAPNYQHYSISDLNWLVTPAVLNRQFALAQLQDKTKKISAPAAVVMWASVSDEIEQRMLASVGQPLRLNAAERKSGGNIWVTDAVGEQGMITVLLQSVQANAFKGRRAKTFARSADGSIRIAQL